MFYENFPPYVHVHKVGNFLDFFHTILLSSNLVALVGYQLILKELVQKRLGAEIFSIPILYTLYIRWAFFVKLL